MCGFTTVLNGTRMRCTLDAHEGKHRLAIDARSLCSERPCSNLANSRGMCMTHYRVAEQAGTLPPSNRGHRKPFPDSWAQPIAAYAAFLRLGDMSPITIELREFHLRRLARELEKPPFEVTLDDLMTYVGEKPWSNETARAVRSTLRSFYQWAAKTKKIAENPAAEFPAIKLRGGSPKPVEEDDFAAAIANAEPRVAIAIRIAGELGLRRAEVAQIHREHLVESDEGFLLKILGKGRKVRHVPIPPRLAADLIAHIDAEGGEWAFPSPEGGHLTPHWIGSLVSRTLPPGYSMHKLRHRALTRAYTTSKDILLTSKLAGHSSVATTQAYYVAPDYSQMRALVEGIQS